MLKKKNKWSLWLLTASLVLTTWVAGPVIAKEDTTPSLPLVDENVVVQEILSNETDAAKGQYDDVSNEAGGIALFSTTPFELALSNGDGSFTAVCSYVTYPEAKAAMASHTSPHAVVRDTRRTIGNQVVAMKQGVAVTTADKVGKSTLSFYYEGSYMVNGYVENRIDAFYFDSTGSTVEIGFSGQRVWVDINQLELVPANLAIQSYYTRNSSGLLVHAVARYTYRQTENRYVGAYESFSIGPAPSFMAEGVKYYSQNGTDFYQDAALTAKAGTFHPYFKYLSFRSKTGYTAAELNAYIDSWNLSNTVLKNTGAYFLEAQETFGVNGAMLLAFAAHESGRGTSTIARDKNNLFGVNAVDSNPYGSATTFNSIRDSILYQAEYMVSRGYMDANTDGRYYGPNLGDKKVGMNVCYASDPYWGEKISGHLYRLDQFLGNKDINKYQLAITRVPTNAYAQPGGTGGIYYKYATKYAELPVGIPVLATGEESGWYEVQSDMGIDDAKTAPASYKTQYQFRQSKAYVAASHLQPINTPSNAYVDPALEALQGTIQYQSHVQKIGWQGWVENGTLSGTTGQSMRLEAIQIQLKDIEGGLEYRTHVENIGWQEYVVAGETSGTSGLGYRLEAINLRLTGEAKDCFDVYYRVHAENFGWMDWAKNDEPAGTAGYAYRLEAIEIVLVPKGEPAPGTTAIPYREKTAQPPAPVVSYQSHVQKIGWQDWVKDGAVSGTSVLSYRLEALQVQLSGIQGGIEYRTHVQNLGWMNYVFNGALSGTTGLAYRLEALEVRLTGDAAANYDVYYRTHVQDFGWLGWTKNGLPSGTAGMSLRMEALQIQLVPKGGPAPGSTGNSYLYK